MSEVAEVAPARKRRGRPPGIRDSKPRKRRTSAELRDGTAPAKVKPVREGHIQAQCIKWLDTVPAPGVSAKLGEFAVAVPNGVWIPGDLPTRMRIIMTQRRQGMRKGYPDISIDFPLHQWHGFKCELKRDKDQTAPGQLREEQVQWLEKLRARGYYCEMAVGIQGFTAAVRRYLAGEPPPPFPWEEGGR